LALRLKKSNNDDEYSSTFSENESIKQNLSVEEQDRRIREKEYEPKMKKFDLEKAEYEDKIREFKHW
jgi:hypothetical protein